MMLEITGWKGQYQILFSAGQSCLNQQHGTGPGKASLRQSPSPVENKVIFCGRLSGPELSNRKRCKSNLNSACSHWKSARAAEKSSAGCAQRSTRTGFGTSPRHRRPQKNRSNNARRRSDAATQRKALEPSSSSMRSSLQGEHLWCPLARGF